MLVCLDVNFDMRMSLVLITVYLVHKYMLGLLCCDAPTDTSKEYAENSSFG